MHTRNRRLSTWFPAGKSRREIGNGLESAPAESHLDSDRLSRVLLLVGILILAVVGYSLFHQCKYYGYLSLASLIDIICVKLWSLGWLMLSVLAIYLLRKHALAPLLVVFAVSAYFVIQYGYLFRGTEFGINGHWGDNSNRLAEIEKMMAYQSFFQDWYLKDLPSFYPPGWFALMAVYAKIMGIDAYQTVKWGYFLIFMVYPWVLYWSWRRLLTPVASAATVVVVLFFSWENMNYVYYESITAALFIPWWAYYVERGYSAASGSRLLSWGDYVVGALIGGLLFMTYYYWFFVAAVVTPVIWGVNIVSTRSLREFRHDLYHKAIIAGGVLIVSSPYWAPLLRVIRRYGSESSQHLWFGTRHMDLTHQWDRVNLQTILIFAGIFAAFYLWKKFVGGRLLYFYLGMLIVVLLDRTFNLDQQSLQSRKILEFVHLFAMLPLGVLLLEFWQRPTTSLAVRRGIFGATLLAAIVVCNAHTEAYNNPLYRAGLTTRVPSEDLAALGSVNTNGTVFLTERYIETVYLPYYLFIPLNNMTSHTAGQYSLRQAFLEKAATITQPDLLAYVLKYNRFSSVDYVYLPLDSVTHKPKITLYQAGFDKEATGVTYKFSCDIVASPTYFVKRSDRGIYEIVAPGRSEEIDVILKSRYPDLYPYLAPVTVSQ